MYFKNYPYVIWCLSRLNTTGWCVNLNLLEQSVFSMILVQILLHFHHPCVTFFTVVLHQPLICLAYFYMWLHPHYNHSCMHSAKEEWKGCCRPDFKLGDVNQRTASTIRGPELCRLFMWPLFIMAPCQSYAPFPCSSNEFLFPFMCLPSPPLISLPYHSFWWPAGTPIHNTVWYLYY